MAASRSLQFWCLMFSLTNGRTWGTMSSSVQVANNMMQTPAALHGFHSSSSSASSCLLSVIINTGTRYCGLERERWQQWGSVKTSAPPQCSFIAAATIIVDTIRWWIRKLVKYVLLSDTCMQTKVSQTIWVFSPVVPPWHKTSRFSLGGAPVQPPLRLQWPNPPLHHTRWTRTQCLAEPPHQCHSSWPPKWSVNKILN